MFDGLSSLADKSLVQVDDSATLSRYKLLESIRQFAARRLFEQDAFAEMRSRHAHFFLDFVGNAEDALEQGDDETLIDIESEMDNLTEAVEWVLLSGDTAAILKIAWPLALLAVPTGRSPQITPWIEQALGDDLSTDALLRAQALLSLGAIAQYLLDFAGALPRNEQALALYRQLGDRKGAARAGAFVAAERFMLEGSPEAVELMKESLDEGRALSDNVTVKFMLVAGLGWANTYTDLVTARDYLEEGLAVAPRAGLINRGLGLSFLAWLAICQGRWSDAISLASEAMDSSGRLWLGQCYALTLHADALLGLGKLQEARQNLLEAKRICEETQNIGIYRYTLHTLARLELAEEGDLESALELAERSVALTAMMAPQFQSASLLSLARVRSARGEEAEAIEVLERTIAIGRELNLQWTLANACNLRAMSLVKSRRFSDAEALCGEALNLFHEGRSSAGVIDSLETMGHIAAGVGKPLDATGLVAAASSLRQETGYVANPKDAARLAHLIEHLKDDLQETFTGAWEEGKGLDMDSAVQWALRGGSMSHEGARERPLRIVGSG
ncbi:MAG: hypothetical protein LC749_12910 [Actinobacteria bacterium]|nr:hypothetical protein [Actinomycetota bacterium]